MVNHMTQVAQVFEFTLAGPEAVACSWAQQGACVGGCCPGGSGGSSTGGDGGDIEAIFGQCQDELPALLAFNSCIDNNGQSCAAACASVVADVNGNEAAVLCELLGFCSETSCCPICSSTVNNGELPCLQSQCAEVCGGVSAELVDGSTSSAAVPVGVMTASAIGLAMLII